MTITVCIFLVVSNVNSLAVDTQTGELFFSMSKRVRTVGKTGNDYRVIVEVANSNIYSIAVDPVLR